MDKTTMKETADRMVEVMRKLESGEIDPEHAKAICMCGKTIIDAQNAELRVIHELKALQRGGIISDDIVYLEPARSEPKRIAAKQVKVNNTISERSMDGWCR